MVSKLILLLFKEEAASAPSCGLWVSILTKLEFGNVGFSGGRKFGVSGQKHPKHQSCSPALCKPLVRYQPGHFQPVRILCLVTSMF